MSPLHGPTLIDVYCNYATLISVFFFCQTKSVILCGIEAHVCVQNTALDLIEKGIDVHVVVDAVSSRSMTDRMYAFERMKAAGAFLTTSESVVLGLAGGSHHPNFRELQKIIWESAPDTGLLGHS
ncbi:UNVERIFIED_CONTAM: hypothetical protein GTU68_051717 [Idotea baltica]|nr:hypothetical protein [Idotea baltica]